MITRITLCSLFCSLLFNTADAETIKFGVYTADKPTAVVKQFRPILNALETQMSTQLKRPISIKMVVSKSYEEGVTALASGLVDFSRFGPASYIAAKETNKSLRILAMESKGGEKMFWGYICVHNESKINSVADLVGKSFAFGNQESTIGRYLSQLYLVENGINSSRLSKYDYLLRHDKVGMSVALKQYDAGALKDNTFNKLVTSGQPLKKIAQFPNVTKPWIASSNLSEELFITLQQALLSLKDKTILKGIKKDGFLLGTDQDYERIRKAIAQNKLFFDKK